MSPEEVKNKLQEHIIRGDSGDGIPNILSPLDTFVTPGKRQITMSKKRYTTICNMSIDEILADSDLSQRYQENDQLVNFRYIPLNIIEDVIESYDTYTHTESIESYLNHHNCLHRHIHRTKFM